MKTWQLFENFNLAELNANFAELLVSVNGAKATYLTANKTVYVATTGNDTTGDGTSGKPYKTITKGLSAIPKNLNGFDATLYIAGGTYAENVTIKGFQGGILSIMLQGNVVLSSFTVSTGQFVLVSASTATTLTITNTASVPIIIKEASKIRFASTVDLVVNAAIANYGIACLSCSILNMDGTATINNAGWAIHAKTNSNVFAKTLAGTGNVIGIQAEDGSTISYGTKTISANKEKVLSGGSIITNDLLSNTATQWNE